MRKIPAYSAQAEPGDKPMLHLTPAQAIAEMRAGNAKWLRGDAIRFVQLQRDESKSPSAIPANAMRRNAEGDPWVRAKVRAWGQLQRQMLAALVI